MSDPSVPYIRVNPSQKAHESCDGRCIRCRKKTFQTALGDEGRVLLCDLCLRFYEGKVTVVSSRLGSVITVKQPRNPVEDDRCCFTSKSPKPKWRKDELRRAGLSLSSQKAMRCPYRASRTLGGKRYCPHHNPVSTPSKEYRRKYEIDPFYDTPAWRVLRFDTLIRDKHTCQYCGEKAEQADHVIPRKNGGPDELGNLAASCSACNRVAANNLFPSFEAKKSWVRLKRRLK